MDRYLGATKSKETRSETKDFGMRYRIEQNGGEGKLWRIGSFKRLAGENFGELQ